MDIRDDPSTTTTTDYDSGDSEGVDYVYEQQKDVKRKGIKGSSSGKKSPKAKPRGVARCTCGASRADGDAEITVFEEETDTEAEEDRTRRPAKSQSHGSEGALACEDKEHRCLHKADRRQGAENKTRREQTPYIEEYPERATRPAILLKEHKIPRRSSTSDAKRVRNSEDRSMSSSSRGRSPAGKRLPPRPCHRRSKGSPQHSGHRKRHLEYQETHEDKVSDSEVQGPSSTSRRHYQAPGPDPTSIVARSSAWSENLQPRYSSSWPLHAGSYPSHRQLGRRDSEYDSEEIEEDLLNNDNTYQEHHRPGHTRASTSRERRLERERKLEQPRQEAPPLQRRRQEQDHGRPSARRPHPRTVATRDSVAAMDHGYRSVATSLCEVWRGQADDWEEPYASASGDDDFQPDIEEPIRLLRMEDLPPRRSSPHLLPPRGERKDFGLQPTNPSPPRYPYHPSTYTNEALPGSHPGIHHNHTWPNLDRNGPFLLPEGPLTLTTEPDAMTDDEDGHDMPPPSRAPPWPRPGLPPRGWTHPLPPRSRAASPVFSARRTREFLSPRPTRAARFDFSAWGCDRASRSSLGLGLL